MNFRVNITNSLNSSPINLEGTLSYLIDNCEIHKFEDYTIQIKIFSNPAEQLHPTQVYMLFKNEKDLSMAALVLA